jgi:CheY-like chemotaxis protein
MANQAAKQVARHTHCFFHHQNSQVYLRDSVADNLRGFPRCGIRFVIWPGMTQSTQNRILIADEQTPAADVLLVRPAPALKLALQSDRFCEADSGRDALGMLRLLRFHLLVTGMDVPDMTPWELFLRARRAQSRLQCVLMDERMTPQDEQRIRQAGASAFASGDPAILEELIRTCPRIAHSIETQGNGIFPAHRPASIPP